MNPEQQFYQGRHDDYGAVWNHGADYNLQNQCPVHYSSFNSNALLPRGPKYENDFQPSYHLNPTQRTIHPQLQPMLVPQWPSILYQSTCQPPALFSAPVPITPASATRIKDSSTHSRSSRKSLSDSDRRRMCLYRDKNPTAKQTEIGAMFGVERSTVSKVLSQRNKYLQPAGNSHLSIKRSKVKPPDIEYALAEKHQGLLLSDLRRPRSHNCPLSSDAPSQPCSSDARSPGLSSRGALDAPMAEHAGSPAAIDNAESESSYNVAHAMPQSPLPMARNGRMTPALDSSLIAPTLEDAAHALQVVLTFLQSKHADFMVDEQDKPSSGILWRGPESDELLDWFCSVDAHLDYHRGRDSRRIVNEFDVPIVPFG